MSTTRTFPAVASVIPSLTSISAAVTVARTVGFAWNPLGTSTLRIGFPPGAPCVLDETDDRHAEVGRVAVDLPLLRGGEHALRIRRLPFNVLGRRRVDIAEPLPALPWRTRRGPSSPAGSSRSSSSSR